MRKLTLALAMLALVAGFTTGYVLADNDDGGGTDGYTYNLKVYTYTGNYVPVIQDGPAETRGVQVDYRWNGSGLWQSDGRYSITCDGILTVDTSKYHATATSIQWKISIPGSKDADNCYEEERVSTSFSSKTVTKWYGAGHNEYIEWY